MSERYEWQVYTSDPDEERRADLLRQMGFDRLDEMTWKQQAEMFEGAPKEVILKYLPKLADEAQVWVWKKALPVGARPEAMKLLSYEAKISLRLARRIKCL